MNIKQFIKTHKNILNIYLKTHYPNKKLSCETIKELIKHDNNMKYYARGQGVKA